MLSVTFHLILCRMSLCWMSWRPLISHSWTTKIVASVLSFLSWVNEWHFLAQGVKVMMITKELNHTVKFGLILGILEILINFILICYRAMPFRMWGTFFTLGLFRVRAFPKNIGLLDQSYSTELTILLSLSKMFHGPNHQ